MGGGGKGDVDGGAMEVAGRLSIRLLGIENF